MPNKKEYNLIEAIEAIGNQVAPDVDIVTVKIVGTAKSPVVRVYIDHEDGVNFDVLTNTQRWVNDILDEIDPFTGSYTLEVTSPGPERPLRKLEHFVKAIGKMAKIKTDQSVEGRKSFTGVIRSVEDEIIEIALDEGKPGSEPIMKVPFSAVISANLKC